MVATTGAQLLPENAVDNILNELLPLSTVLTPNIPEAVLLLQKSGVTVDPKPSSLRDLQSIANQLARTGPKYVLLKGGHLPLDKSGEPATKGQKDKVIFNILVTDNNDSTPFTSAYSDSKNTHGTGCSLASAIACNIAMGMPVKYAVERGLRYVEAGIATSFSLGKGHGPINHFHSVQRHQFTP